VQILGEVHQPKAVGALLSLAVESRDSALRAAALLSLRRYDDPQIPTAILGMMSKLTDDEREAALRLLVARPASARLLLAGIDRGEIDRRAVPSDLVQELRLQRDAVIATAMKRLFPASQAADSSLMTADLDRLGKIIAAQPGTPKNGRELFAQHCAKCHTLFGKGGTAGPDLTSYPRHDLPNLILHVVDPNAAIREGYLTSVVTTSDGRVLTGFVVDQDNQLVVLRGSDGKDLPLARDGIEEIQPSKLSLMPEGLLKDFNDEQVRDLFAYLRSSQPVIDQ
jgi:putative heme-binding domain-containing protein